MGDGGSWGRWLGAPRGLGFGAPRAPLPGLRELGAECVEESPGGRLGV